MVRRFWIGMACLAACAPHIAVDAPAKGDLSREAVHVAGDGPPDGPEGTCWAHDLIPAVYETTTEQSLVTAEKRDADGRVVTPAAYKSVSRLRVLQDRRDIWFTAPCPDEMTPGFLATLQRALKARGYYTADLTGTMDDATTEALRRYQADHGLDSPLLSRAAAQQLGVATTALPE
ncbi:MAG: peptidoglycan-binding protein [Pseudorhodobacter sp.]|nr:peptidoglycan-binding protein [Pseudorhodobacter sp.]